MGAPLLRTDVPVNRSFASSRVRGTIRGSPAQAACAGLLLIAEGVRLRAPRSLDRGGTEVADPEHGKPVTAPPRTDCPAAAAAITGPLVARRATNSVEHPPTTTSDGRR